MDSITNFFQSPLMNAISFFVGLFGLLLGYIFFRMGQKEKLPFWTINTNNLLIGFSNKLEKLCISYDGSPIENLSVSKIVFWNGGKEPLDKSDISDVNFLKIVSRNSSVRILDAKILTVNCKASKANIDLDITNSIIKINFEYLNYNKGIVIQAIHTGIGTSDLIVDGDIKGVTRIEYKRIPKEKMNGDSFVRALLTHIGWIIQIISFLLLAVFLIIGGKNITISILGGIVFGVIIPGIYIWKFIESFRLNIPKGLEVTDKI